MHLLPVINKTNESVSRDTHKQQDEQQPFRRIKPQPEGEPERRRDGGKDQRRAADERELAAAHPKRLLLEFFFLGIEAKAASRLIGLEVALFALAATEPGEHSPR